MTHFGRLSAVSLILLLLMTSVFAESSPLAGADPEGVAGAGLRSPERYEETGTPQEPGDPEEPAQREDEDHKPYVSGYNDGTFRPNRGMTRAELAQMVCTLLELPEGDASFSDVSPKKWYAAAVSAAASAGCFDGYEDGTFRPNKQVTRAEFVTVLCKLSDAEVPQDPAGFPDVSASSWAYPYVCVAQAQSWVGGYPDGTFQPNRPVSRAEAVAMMNNFLGRTPDEEAIAAGETRFFPDVKRSAWYYGDVMEATIGHSAHYAETDSQESWTDPYWDAVSIPNGYYYVGGKLYVVEDGSYVHTQQDGVCWGVPYHCAGASGVCTVDAEVLRLADGTLHLIQNGVLAYAPGKISAGFYVRGGKIYAAEAGWLVHTAKSGALNGVGYTCQGASGVCTVNASLLADETGQLWHLENGTISFVEGVFECDGLYLGRADGTVLRDGDWNGLHFGADGRYTSGNATIDAYIDNLVSSVTDASMTQEEKLFACYCYVATHCDRYIPNNNHVPRGQDCSLWSETYMLRLIQQNGGGNCYCFASEFYYMARRIGYWQARAVSGASVSQGSDHGWVEMILDGVTYGFDPRGDGKYYVQKYGYAPGRLYKKTYDEMPWQYWRYW